MKDGSTSRARLVDGECKSFENQRSRKICRVTREQEISAQTWGIPREKMNINVLQDGVEENVGAYAKEQCSISAGMGKYVPVQKNHEIQEKMFNQDKGQNCDGINTTKNCLQHQEETRLYFYRKS